MKFYFILLRYKVKKSMFCILFKSGFCKIIVESIEVSKTHFRFYIVIRWLLKVHSVFIYYIWNWFSKILYIIDKLSNIWVVLINNESKITYLRIWFFSHFFTLIFLTLKNYTVEINKLLYTRQWYESVDENIIWS